VYACARAGRWKQELVQAIENARTLFAREERRCATVGAVDGAHKPVVAAEHACEIVQIASSHGLKDVIRGGSSTHGGALGCPQR
jgi:hypothetical protein